MRYKIETPWMMPFSDPALYENPTVLQVLERLWDSSDFLISDYISYHPCPGCSALNWHRDGELFATNVVLPVFPCLSLQIALVDTNERNGSFELLPSTHHCGVPELSHLPGSGGGQGLNPVDRVGALSFQDALEPEARLGLHLRCAGDPSRDAQPLRPRPHGAGHRLPAFLVRSPEQSHPDDAAGISRSCRNRGNSC